MARESLVAGWRFCPECAGSLLPRVLKEGEPPRLVCVQCGFAYRPSPQIAAAAALLYDSGIVLVRRANDPEAGRWTLPGGFVDLGESVAAAAVRETLEETGLKVNLTGVLDVYSFTGNGVAVVVYAADVSSGTLHPGSECREVRAFPPEALPWDELAFASTPAALRDYLRRFFPRVRQPR
jgi:ADP-ribose pyrophosphatase YjhB (NUDIX family)